MYLKINDEDYDKVCELLGCETISFVSNKSSLYFTIDEKVRDIIENNVFVNNIEDMDEVINFIYSEFDMSAVDSDIINKLAIYESGKE